MKAGELYGTNSVAQQAVASAWRDVGIRIPGAPTGARSRGPSRGRSGEVGRDAEPSKHTDTLVALTKRVEALAAQLKTLAKDVNALKEKK